MTTFKGPWPTFGPTAKEAPSVEKTAPTEAVHQFSTGAVRSTDADDVRYDLISPIAVKAVAERFAEGFTEEYHTPSETSKILGAAKMYAYRFLAGERGDMLAMHAICILDAIQAETNDELPPHFYGDVSDEENGYDLIYPAGLRAVARACKEGIDKGYQPYNWEKGMDVASLLNHGLKHIDNFLEGLDTDEDELGHAAWNAFGAIHSLAMWPHLNTQLRGPGCVPPPPRDEPMNNVEPAAAASAGGPCEACSSPLICNFLADCGSPGILCEPGPSQRKPHRIPRLDDPRDGSTPPPVLYLSGPMSGIEAFNFPAFNSAAEELRRMGFPVLNPADFGWGEADWSKNLARDIWLLGQAEILVQLPDWEASRGASLEYNTAVSLGKGVASLSEILDLA